MHGERYPDATTAGAIVQRLDEENRTLRAALTEKSRECEHWKREAEKRGAVGWNQHD